MGAACTERILLETLDKISELKSVHQSSKKNQHLWCEEPTEKFSRNANEKDKKKKSNTGDCESYMGNWIFCGRGLNPWERSNNIWEKDSYFRKIWVCTLKSFAKYRVKLPKNINNKLNSVFCINVFIFTELQGNAQIFSVWGSMSFDLQVDRKEFQNPSKFFCIPF